MFHILKNDRSRIRELIIEVQSIGYKLLQNYI